MASSKKKKKKKEQAVARGCSLKPVFVEILENSQESNFIKKEAVAQVFSCKFYEIFKNTFYYRTPLVAASVKKERKFFKLAFKLN